jgi:hypothetical protein
MAMSDRNMPPVLKNGDWYFDEKYAPSSSVQEAFLQKSFGSQWNPYLELDWTCPIDSDNPLGYDDRLMPIFGTAAWRDATSSQKGDWRRSYHAFTVSQYLHGEQAALLGATRLVEVLPDIHNKCLAAMQVVDEARHVFVFEKMLREKMDGQLFALDSGLKTLIQTGLNDSQWDMVVLTTQVLIEGWGLAAFAQMSSFGGHQLIRDIGRGVMIDESRHVAFGLQILETLYPQLSTHELAIRHEFAMVALETLAVRPIPDSVWSVEIPERTRVAFTNRLQSKAKQLINRVFAPYYAR